MLAKYVQGPVIPSMLGNNVKNTNKSLTFINIPFKNSNLSITESDHGINAFSD